MSGLGPILAGLSFFQQYSPKETIRCTRESDFSAEIALYQLAGFSGFQGVRLKMPATGRTCRQFAKGLSFVIYYYLRTRNPQTMTLGTVYGTDESDSFLSFDLFIQNGQKKIEPVYNESPEDCRPAWPCRCNVCVFLVLIYTAKLRKLSDSSIP